jgi:hypothetical protein
MKYIPILLLLLSSCAEFSMNKVIVTYNQQSVTVNNKNEEALNGCIIINDTENGGKAISSFFLVGGKSTVSVVRDSLIDNTTGYPIVQTNKRNQPSYLTSVESITQSAVFTSDKTEKF